MVVPAAFFDALATLQAVEAERCTALHGVPTMFIAELEHPEFSRFNLSSLRTGIMAGAPCPIEIMRRVVETMNLSEMTIAYGLTEASPVITQTTVDDPIELRVATVGKPLPHTEVKIIDVATGQIVPHGTPGELCTRGYMVMKGYYRNDEATRAAIEPDGWLHTGDLATMDANGYCKITGRAKDVIIRGGENIYPREIEEFCRGRIATFKIPRYWKFVEEFPMTVTGKVQKFRMREMAIEELGLTSQSLSAA